MVVGSAAATTDSEGMVVFTYDDGPIEDYTETFPVHQEHDAPASIAVCPGLMDRDDFMGPERVTVLHECGWEIMSHTLEHRALGKIPLERDVAEGDDRLYVQAHRHGQFAGDPLTIFDDHREVTATSAGSGTDGDGQYIELEEELDSNIDADDGFVRYTEAFTREILEESKHRLEELDVPVTGFVYPYGRSEGLVADLVPEYYDSVPNHRYSRDGFNPIDDLEPTRMVRQQIETDRASPADIDQFMASVADRDVVGVVGGHSQYETLPADRIDLALERAEDHGLRVVTLQEALLELDVLDALESPKTGDGNVTDSHTEEVDEMPGFGGTIGAVGAVGGVALAIRWLESSEPGDS